MNKIGFWRIKDGQVQIGFYAPKSHNIIETETCFIQPEVNDELIKYIKKWMIEYSISPISFYQVNPVQTELLYNKALEYADLKGNEKTYDIRYSQFVIDM